MARSFRMENRLPLFVGSIMHQLLTVMYCSSPWAAPSCSRPQSAMDNGVRDCRSNLLTITPHPCFIVIIIILLLAQAQVGKQNCR